MSAIAQLISGMVCIHTQLCAIPRNVGISLKLQTEQKPLTFCPVQRRCFPWSLIAGFLNENRKVVAAAAAGLRVAAGRGKRVFVRVLVPEKGK